MTGRAIYDYVRINLLYSSPYGEYKKLPELIRHFRSDKLTIHCDGPTSINLDGELRTAQTVEMKISDHKIRFFYPKNLTWQNPVPTNL